MRNDQALFIHTLLWKATAFKISTCIIFVSSWSWARINSIQTWDDHRANMWSVAWSKIIKSMIKDNPRETRIIKSIGREVLNEPTGWSRIVKQEQHLYLSLFFVLVPLSTIRCHVNDYNHLLNVSLSSSPQVSQIGELQAKGKILWWDMRELPFWQI